MTPFPEIAALARENREDRLGDFLGLMRIAGVPERDRINLVDVPRDEHGKSILGAALGIFLQQSDVIQFLHLHFNCHRWKKRYK